jgi:poly-gamma-glutamate synthesis protein (capsule biosynthesis protein)
MQHRGQAADDFHACYAELAPLLRGFDLAMGNLEFPVDPSRPIGPDPGTTRFNGSPAHLGALADAGFDLLATANNHAYDQGIAGLEETVKQIGRRGMVPVGTADSLGRLAPVMTTVNGVRIGVVAYTIPTNVHSDSTGKPDWPPPTMPMFVLNFADWSEEYRAQGVALFREHVARARATGADFVVAFVHWGREWHFEPSEDQRLAAHDLVDAGFDLVVGSHGHVLNPPELYRGKLIAYSLGNFISDFRPPATRTGAVLEVDLVKPTERAARIADFRYYPTIVERNGHVVRLLRHTMTGEAAEALRDARAVLGESVREPAR